MRSLKMIFFDAANTLFLVKGSVGKIYADCARDMGLTLDAGLLHAKFRDAFRAAPPLCFPEQPASKWPEAERQWWKQLVTQVVNPSLFPSATDFDRYFEELYARFADADTWEVYEDVVETLTSLKSVGFRLGVISNFDSRLLRILNQLNLDVFFERVICSGAVGCAKPSPEIFRAALPEGVDAQEAMHVGDDPILDLAGALRAGWRALLLDRKQVKKAEREALVIASLAELKSKVTSERPPTPNPPREAKR